MYIGAHRAYRGFIVQLETWASGPGEFNQHTPKLPFKMIEKGGTALTFILVMPESKEGKLHKLSKLPILPIMQNDQTVVQNLKI